MDVFCAKLVDELKDSSGDCCFTDSGHVAEGADRGFVFENDAVKFRDVELISRRTRRDVEREAFAGEDGTSEVKHY